MSEKEAGGGKNVLCWLVKCSQHRVRFSTEDTDVVPGHGEKRGTRVQQIGGCLRPRLRIQRSGDWKLAFFAKELLLLWNEAYATPSHLYPRGSVKSQGGQNLQTAFVGNWRVSGSESWKDSANPKCSCKLERLKILPITGSLKCILSCVPSFIK